MLPHDDIEVVLCKFSVKRSTNVMLWPETACSSDDFKASISVGEMKILCRPTYEQLVSGFRAHLQMPGTSPSSTASPTGSFGHSLARAGPRGLKKKKAVRFRKLNIHLI